MSVNKRDVLYEMLTMLIHFIQFSVVKIISFRLFFCTVNIGSEQKFVAFFSSKISIF